MDRLTWNVIVIALCLGCSAFAFPAQSQSLPANQKTVKQPLLGSVSGRVSVHGKGKSGIVVGLTTESFQIAPALKGATDSEGNYKITNVPAGAYRVAPLAPAYSVPDLNPFEFRGKRLILAEGESVDGVDFSIIRGAVITGKITDANGRPLVEERVSVTREGQNEQMMSPSMMAAGFATDDRGIYRIFGLAPGKYKVSAGVTDQRFPGNNRGRVAYPLTYYRTENETGEATIVDLSEGEEANNIDITLREAGKTFAASGVVIDGQTNKPVSNVRLGVQKMMDDRSGPITTMGTMVNSLGEFRIESLPPGKYGVILMPLPNSEARSEPLVFNVVDGDVSGLIVRTIKAASLTGIVVVEGKQNQSVLAKLAGLRIIAAIQTDKEGGGGGGSFPQPSNINADGSFRLGGLQPGVATFHIIGQDFRSESGFTITRIEHNGVQVPGVEVRTAEPISGVKVFVVHGTGTIRGIVKFENGPPPANARFMVRATLTGIDNPMGYRPQELDTRGRFMITGLPEGTYDVHVTGYLTPRTVPLIVRQSVNVTEGNITDVELVLDVGNRVAP